MTDKDHDALALHRIEQKLDTLLGLLNRPPDQNPLVLQLQEMNKSLALIAANTTPPKPPTPPDPSKIVGITPKQTA